MKTAALIPARFGSVGIKDKNTRIICGKPLIHWAIEACCNCELIDTVFVATNCDETNRVAREYKSEKLEIIERSQESATSYAVTEIVMREFFGKYKEFNNIMLVQATNPFVEACYLSDAIKMLNSGYDSALSVVRQKRFIWNDDKNGASPHNYDIFNRPMRQDFNGFFVENGSFYITKNSCFRDTGNRVSGSIGLVEMPSESYFELDEEEDLIIVEKLLAKKYLNSQVTETNKPEIKALFTDCDGVLTDGGMYITEKGDEMKRFSVKDGVAFNILKEKKIITGIISGESRRLIAERARKMGINHLYLGVTDKLAVMSEFCTKHSIRLEEVAYIGDELNDLAVMKAVKYSFAVQNAAREIKDVAYKVLDVCGGDGAVREVVRFLFD